MKFSQVLHPYYKLAYIKLSWGGPEEQAAEIEQGNPLAKDWHDEAKKIVEKTVRYSVRYKWNALLISKPDGSVLQPASSHNPSASKPWKSNGRGSRSVRIRQASWNVAHRWCGGRLGIQTAHTMQRDVTKETDLVEWWQVSYFPSGYCWNVHLLTCLRTMHNYSLHLHVSHLMSFLPRLHLSHANSYSLAPNR